MFKKWLKKTIGEDTYHQEIYNRRHESQQEEEDNFYSVLIHFLPDRKNAHIYMMKNIEIECNDVATIDIGIEEENYIFIQGSYVFHNSFDSKVDAQKFIDGYKLVDPIWGGITDV